MPTTRNEGKIRYLIVTPVRNEKGFIERTIQSVVAQTVRPGAWIIADDASTDGTRELVEKYARKFDWIKVTDTQRSGRRDYGRVQAEIARIIRGLDLDEYDYIVKLDADLEFSPTYFAELFQRFRENPRLGIAGGGLYYLQGSTVKEEKTPGFHVRGPTKVYRRQCWDEIGGLSESYAYDTLDEVKAQMNGWETRTFADLRVHHLRKTGTANGCCRGMFGKGICAYLAGYHPLFLLIRAIRHLPDRPFMLAGLSMLSGFIWGYLRRLPREKDKAVIRYLRKQQMNKLLLQKTIWK